MDKNPYISYLILSLDKLILPSKILTNKLKKLVKSHYEYAHNTFQDRLELDVQTNEEPFKTTEFYQKTELIFEHPPAGVEKLGSVVDTINFHS